ncbi:RNA-directed DNA polymerase, eukaryota, reverse transcriptase zinc-binding domain protein [Tanacetum coccineum]
MTLITERIDWAGSEERWEEKENEFSNMLRQKARIRWDVEGDENSKFFHSYIKRRNNKSNIRGLMINGIGVEDPKLIKWKWRDIQTSVYGRGATVHQSSGYKELLPMENAGWLMDIRRVSAGNGTKGGCAGGQRDHGRIPGWRWEWIGDKWRWTLNGDGDFSVKDLSRLVEEKILDVERGGQETIWNKLVPKKVNIFVWRVLKGRIPVREELDKRGIDLDSVLCPCCDSVVESCAHSLVLCDLARGVWEKIFSWWKVGNVNAFTINELFLANGGVNVPSLSSRFWQAVIWTTGYYIWKERNARVFGKKISSVNKIVQGIQLKSYEWIVRRTKNK